MLRQGAWQGARQGVVEAYWLTDHCMTRRWHSITILQYAFEELSIQIS